MGSTSSWTTPLITFGGVLLTLAVTMWLDQRKARRETRFQWTTHLLTQYRDFLAACNELRQARVWPAVSEDAATDIDSLVGRLQNVSSEARFLAHRDVTGQMTKTVQAAERLSTAIADVRANSRPGHAGQIDQRLRPAYDAALLDFVTYIDDFIEAARTDIDLRSPFARSAPA